MKKISVLLLAAAAILAGSHMDRHAGAATRLTDDFAELLRASQLVIVARATEVNAAHDARLGIPLTVATVTVEKVYRGQLSPGTELQVEYLGGSDGINQVVVPGQPELKAGDHALLLLFNTHGRWRVIGGDAGEAALFRDDSGKTFARRMEGRFDYFVTDAASPTGYRHVQSTLLGTETLDKLIVTVLVTGKAVIESAPTASAAPPVHANSIQEALERQSSHSSNALVYAFCGCLGLVGTVWTLLRLRRSADSITAS